MNRATGLLIIEVTNSNPNGNPDQESDPRLRPDERGMISPVSFKRKLRDLVEEKEGPVWLESASSFTPPLKADEYQILESRGRDRNEITGVMRTRPEEFIRRYWDGRLFGNTFLEKQDQESKEANTTIRTGVVQFGMGVSICPVEVERMTNSSKAGVESDKNQGLAPLAYRIVLHGVYTMPYFVNPTTARKSGCTDIDIELMKRLIPHAYTHTASYIRPMVTIRHAWHIEHKSALGSCPDFSLIEALTPKRVIEADKDAPSRSWDDYNTPGGLPKELSDRVESLTDLVS
jgi:Cas7 group CRISPR-associated protein Csh2